MRRTCILGAALQPCASGMIGELYIDGQCLARDYLDRLGQAIKCFVADPFSGSGERLYRTGDLMRYHVDGQVEYLGRVGQQIRTRGFHIEIGEIESQLLTRPYVAEAAVVAQDGIGDPLLTVYLMGRDAMRSEDPPTELDTWLTGRLPAYMQPTA